MSKREQSSNAKKKRRETISEDLVVPEVDVVLAAQAMVRHRQETIRIGWEVDPSDDPLLRRDGIHETRPLMAEAVVVIAPAGRRQEIVE